jgi:hypothetical protein
MLETLKKRWKEFKKAPPGERFEQMHRAGRESGLPLVRIVMVIAGVAMIVGGVVLLAIPGPGLLVIAFGGALLAQQFLWVARKLDRLELVLRNLYARGLRFWKGSSTPVRASILGIGALCAAGAAYLGYSWFFKN